MSTKKFLYIMLALYVAGAVVGVALFRSPGLSRAYLKEFGKEHKEFLKIKKSDWFKAYEERPALHPPVNEHQREQIEFVEHYEANPRFHAEETRAFRYTIYFRFLNAAVFIALMAFALRKPLGDYLDGKIAEIRSELDEAAKAREEAARLKEQARGKIEHWEEVEAAIIKEADQALEKDLAKINQEFEQSKAQFEKELADRRLAEQYRAERTIKTELVEQAIAAVENRYRTEATLERLTQNVDTFTKLMERLS
ncbi:MAG TPA: hypothetical protein PK967_13760 [Candidatus Hydrogenedentes bacterium]|nr:hypothetical protein [Candidatus Hydrogenedentota bacterium]